MVYNWPAGNDRYNRVAKFVDRTGHPSTTAAPELQRQFDQFLKDNPTVATQTPEQKQLLIRQFLEWQKNGGR